MSDRASDPALVALITQIARTRGFGCHAYKESCLRRRLAVRMRALGIATYDEYARALQEDDEEYEQLLKALTINVTKFYRNAETWDALTSEYMPALWRSRRGTVRCWSAGCASGEEPYTIGMSLLETALAGRHVGTVRSRVDATDLDVPSLERARAGIYPESAFDEIPSAWRSRYFTGEGPCTVGDPVRSLVTFQRHDLLQDPPPAAPYDLIVCRNVVIYFDRETQDRLFLEFADALAPGGVLVLGKVETLFGESRRRFMLENTRERIYRLI